MFQAASAGRAEDLGAGQQEGLGGWGWLRLTLVMCETCQPVLTGSVVCKEEQAVLEGNRKHRRSYRGEGGAALDVLRV